MKLIAEGVGKKFDRNWIFRDLSFQLASGERVAITGRNGSGKSTLLRILTGSLSATKGQISYFEADAPISNDLISSKINFCAPYIELPEEFTLHELLVFHANFRKPILQIENILERFGYPDAWHKKIGHYSSGMKQRVRLLLAFFFDGHLIALDEPTTNLDETGISWYQSEINQIAKNKTILISSNQRSEYGFCEKNIELSLS